MKLPLRWLKEYVDLDVDSKEISDKLTDSGSHVESIESLEIDVKNVVILINLLMTKLKII